MRRPAVRINQLGYLASGPKRAVWVSERPEPAGFRVEARGADVFRGRTRPWPVTPEPTSGLAVHTLDFSELRTQGDGFVIEVEGARSHPFALADGLYRDLARDALAFLLPLALRDRDRRGARARLWPPGRSPGRPQRRGLDRPGRRAPVPRLVLPGTLRRLRRLVRRR
jgi:hypothetical protein